MQADLEGRRTTQLWQQSKTGLVLSATDVSFRAAPVYFREPPPSFESNVRIAPMAQEGMRAETAPQGQERGLKAASEGKLEL
jgi:hypothetical protein